ncbi:MAG: hypothetical protein ACI959_001417 [Limisphaerales bacterium]|jgi:hypothetical protein
MRWTSCFTIALLFACGLSFEANAAVFKTVDSDDALNSPVSWSNPDTWQDGFVPPTKLQSDDQIVITSVVHCEVPIILNGATLTVEGRLSLSNATLLVTDEGHIEVKGVLTIQEGSLAEEVLTIAQGGQYEEWVSLNWGIDEPEQKDNFSEAPSNLYIYPNPSKSGEELNLGGQDLFKIGDNGKRFQIISVSDGSVFQTGFLSGDDTRVPVEGIMPPGAYLFLIDGIYKILSFTVTL